MAFSTYYDSADTGLGGFANTAGALITFLDKVLINGYNSQSGLALSRSGATVTVTQTAHGYRELQMITIAGASISDYNGMFQVDVGSVTANTFTFQIATTPSTPPTGTITAIATPLGWTKPFSGTNLAAYRQPAGSGFYLQVDDTGTTSARGIGYESMTGISLGSLPFPTTALLSGGIWFPKSNGVARRVICWGNQKTFYIFTDYTGDSSSGNMFSFGDFTSYRTGDAFNCQIGGNQSSATSGEFWQVAHQGYDWTLSQMARYFGGQYLARSFTQLPGSVPGQRGIDMRFISTGASPSNGMLISIGGNYNGLAYPSPVDGGLWTSPVRVIEPYNYTVRGYLNGVVAPCHSRPLVNYTIYDGAGSLAGKKLLYIHLGALGSLLAEVSNTWA
jgi:hypothetical protein